MNKLTKAAIAGAAGIALLLGGAGTLASWNADATATGGTITAGEMTIEAVAGGGTWTDAKQGAINIATFKAVPGDVLTYTANFNVTAVGDNLSATVGLTPGSIAAESASAEDVKLASLLTDSSTFTVDSVTTTTITQSTGTQVVSVAVSITWPDGAPTDDNAAMNGAVDLSNMTITLTQNP